MLRQAAPVPEKGAGDLIGRRFHVKDHADALLFPGSGLGELHGDGGGKIPVSFVPGLIVFSDVDHTPQVFDQAAVGIVRGRFVKKSSSVRVGVEQDLQGVDHRGLAASGMSGEKIDAPVQLQHLRVDIMPVVQDDPGDRLEGLILILHFGSLLLPVRRPARWLLPPRPPHPPRLSPPPRRPLPPLRRIRREAF